MSIPSPASHIHTSPQVSANLTDIEKALTSLWDSLNEEARNGQSLSRACMSNLVIYCDSPQEANTVLEDIPKIIEAHPARVLLLIGEADGNEALKAYISVHYCAVSEGWQLCAEQVTVYCDKSAAKRLPSIPRSLCIGNLPTALWWASSLPPPMAGEIFYSLAGSADQVIFDSIGWREPVKGVLAVAHWIGGSQDKVIYSLAWRRLKAWRKLLREALDPLTPAGAIDTVARLEIEHGPHAFPVAWLLVGWLAARLHWEPATGKLLSQSAMTWRFERRDGSLIDVQVKRRDAGRPWIYQLQWHWSAGDGGMLCFSQLSEYTLGVKSHTVPVADTVIAMPKVGRAELVAKQLAHRFHDELFEDALVLSTHMANILLD